MIESFVVNVIVSWVADVLKYMTKWDTETRELRKMEDLSEIELIEIENLENQFPDIIGDGTYSKRCSVARQELKRRGYDL